MKDRGAVLRMDMGFLEPLPEIPTAAQRGGGLSSSEGWSLE